MKFHNIRWNIKKSRNWHESAIIWYITTTLLQSILSITSTEWCHWSGAGCPAKLVNDNLWFVVMTSFLVLHGLISRSHRTATRRVWPAWEENKELITYFGKNIFSFHNHKAFFSNWFEILEWYQIFLEVNGNSGNQTVTGISVRKVTNHNV